MAKISKWVIFARAFLITLIASQPAQVGGSEASEDQAWRAATQSNSVQAYHAYLSVYPAGAYVRDAIVALQNLGAIQGGVPTRGLAGGTQNVGGSLY